MTVNVDSSREEILGDGSTVEFVFTFPVQEPDSVFAELATDEFPEFTVTISGDQATAPGGTVTFATAPGDGDEGVIYRLVDLTQETLYTPYDPFPAKSHEAALDKLTLIAQDQDEMLSRALTTPILDGPSDVEVPVGESGRYLKWDSQGENLANGWTETDMDARFAPIVHTHPISDVVGLQSALDSKKSVVDSDAADAALQDQVDDLDATKADDSTVVHNTGDEPIAGLKSFYEVTPRSPIDPTEPNDIANKRYVDLVQDSLTGIIFRGTLDVSAGDGALPGSPDNGDRYFIGVGGTITVSDGSGPSAPTAVDAGGTLTWSANDGYWLYQPGATAATEAAAVTYDSTGNVILTGTTVAAALSQSDIQHQVADGRMNNYDTDLEGTVQTTGNQSIGGVKTFTSAIRAPGLQSSAGVDMVVWSGVYGTIVGHDGEKTTLWDPQVVATGGAVTPVLTVDNIVAEAGAVLMDYFLPEGTTILLAEDPNVKWPGTTWIEDCQSRVVVGAGTGTDDAAVPPNPAPTLVAGTEYGEYAHTQTVDELAQHFHVQTVSSRTVDRPSGSGYPATRVSSTDTNTGETGASEPFNIMQASVVKRYWTRVPNP